VIVEQQRLATFESMYGDLPASALGRRELLDWQARIGHLRPATRRAYVGAVGRFCRWLLIEGHVEADLTAHLVKVREPRRAPRALRADDVARVIAACPSPRARASTLLMVQCGLRCVEVSRLDLDDWDDRARTVMVRGKGGHERILPVPDGAAAALDAYVAERGLRPGPLFLATGSKGGPDGRLSARWISKQTGRAMTAAGVHRTAHDGRTAHALRHTAATDVLDRCHDLRVVQQMLGHDSLQSTQIYLGRAELGRLREAMAGRAYLSPTGTDGLTMSSPTTLRGVPGPGALSPVAGDPTKGHPSHPAT
jgi:integrase